MTTFLHASTSTCRRLGLGGIARGVAAIALAAAATAVPLASPEPAQALTVRCTPAGSYVPLELIPPDLRAADRGCQYRQAIAASGNYAAMYTWRGVGTTRCLNIWRTSVQYKYWTNWQVKNSVLPAWCNYYAGYFVWYF